MYSEEFDMSERPEILQEARHYSKQFSKYFNLCKKLENDLGLPHISFESESDSEDESESDDELNEIIKEGQRFYRLYLHYLNRYEELKAM